MDYDDTVLLRDRGTIDTIRNLIVALSPSYWHNSDEQWKGLTENPHNVANLIYVAALRKWISAYLVRSRIFGNRSAAKVVEVHKVRTRCAQGKLGICGSESLWHDLFSTLCLT